MDFNTLDLDKARKAAYEYGKQMQCIDTGVDKAALHKIAGFESLVYEDVNTQKMAAAIACDISKEGTPEDTKMIAFYNGVADGSTELSKEAAQGLVGSVLETIGRHVNLASYINDLEKSAGAITPMTKEANVITDSIKAFIEALKTGTTMSITGSLLGGGLLGATAFAANRGFDTSVDEDIERKLIQADEYRRMAKDIKKRMGSTTPSIANKAKEEAISQSTGNAPIY